MKFLQLSAISLFALSSSLCVTGPGAGYPSKELSSSAQVDKTMNEFFGPNIYPSQEIIANNAKNNVANKYSPTPKEIREETCKKIKGRIVSDVKDAARVVLQHSVISSGSHDAIVTEVGKTAERDFDNAVYYTHEDGYARFMGNSKNIHEKARALVKEAAFPG